VTTIAIIQFLLWDQKPARTNVESRGTTAVLSDDSEIRFTRELDIYPGNFI
jgi:hypothetical protein